jgi:hypothetical protein
MPDISRRSLLAALAGAPLDGWIPLFDGHSLTGWEANDPSSWRVESGAIVADGPKSHLFYKNGDFRNFEFSAEVLTGPRANSGIFFHTRYQEAGWPSQGLQVEINSSAEPQRTGSLFGVRNIYKQLASDGEWFTLLVSVRGNGVQIRLNDVLLVDYLEPAPPQHAAGQPNGRVLARGTFALQCHDPVSKARFRNIRVRRLPDLVASATREAPVSDETSQRLLNLMSRTVPVIDYRVRLEGRDIEDVLTRYRHMGFGCGILVGSAKEAAALRGQPCFVGLEASGPDWRRQLTPDFDYVAGPGMVGNAAGEAIEIGNETTVASVKQAKAAGVKFVLGGGGRLAHAMAVAEECQLGWRDFFLPS